jgi:hypothetical protein
MELALDHVQARETGRGCDKDSATAAIAVAGSERESHRQ